MTHTSLLTAPATHTHSPGPLKTQLLPLLKKSPTCRLPPATSSSLGGQATSTWIFLPPATPPQTLPHPNTHTLPSTVSSYPQTPRTPPHPTPPLTTPHPHNAHRSPSTTSSSLGAAAINTWTSLRLALSHRRHVTTSNPSSNPLPPSLPPPKQPPTDPHLRLQAV